MWLRLGIRLGIFKGSRYHATLEWESGVYLWAARALRQVRRDIGAASKAVFKDPTRCYEAMATARHASKALENVRAPLRKVTRLTRGAVQVRLGDLIDEAQEALLFVQQSLEAKLKESTKQDFHRAAEAVATILSIIENESPVAYTYWRGKWVGRNAPELKLPPKPSRPPQAEADPEGSESVPSTG